MTYTVRMSFLADTEGSPKDPAAILEDPLSSPVGGYDPANWTGGQTNTDLPANVQIEYTGFYSSDPGTPVTQTVTCKCCNKEVEDTDVDNQLRVNLLYKGRVVGTHWAKVRNQMTSVRQPFSLDTDSEGDKIGIGPDFEGVSRHMPMHIVQVKEVKANTGGFLFSEHDTSKVGGSVNEQGWAAPWDAGNPYDEGAFIYMGITSSSVDRQTDTVEFIHEFMNRDDRADQHYHRWYDYVRKLGSDGNVKLKYDSSVTTAQFLPVAGTDDWWDNGVTIPTWDFALDLDEVWTQ